MSRSPDPVVNLAQMFAHLHGCARPGLPVCDACTVRARTAWAELTQPTPA